MNKLNANRKQIVLKNKVNTATAIAYTNPVKLNRILNNLILNAIKFTPSSGFIELDLTENDTHNIISIADTGIGIKMVPQKKHVNLATMQSYFATEQEGSWGLGLQICQDLASEIKAEISFKSQINIGTTFYVKFKKTMSCDEIM